MFPIVSFHGQFAPIQYLQFNFIREYPSHVEIGKWDQLFCSYWSIKVKFIFLFSHYICIKIKRIFRQFFYFFSNVEELIPSCRNCEDCYQRIILNLVRLFSLSVRLSHQRSAGSEERMSDEFGPRYFNSKVTELS